MPQIKEYTQRVGIEGGFNTTSASPQTEGSFGRGLQQIGGAIADVGNVLYQIQSTKEVSDASAKVAELNLKYTQKLQSLSNSGSLDMDKLNQEFDADLEQIGSRYSTRGAVDYISRAAPQLKQSLASDAIKINAELSKVSFVQNAEKTLSAYEQSVKLNPNNLQSSKAQLAEAINSMSGDPVLKAKILEQGNQRIDIAQIDGVMKATPDGKLPDLMKSLDVGGEYDDRGFSNQTRKELIQNVRREISIREADKSLRESKQKEAFQKRDEATQQQILLDITSGKNELSNDDIAKMMRDPDKAMSMINWKMSFGKKLSSGQSKALMTEAYEKINLPDSDSRKIFDFEQLRPYTEKMEPKDAAWLAGQLAKAPAEKQNNALKKQFFTAAKTTMGIDPLSKISDPKRDELFASFMIEFDEEYTKKRSEGISPTELLNPKSKNSMYPMLDKYKRSLNERLADQAASLKNNARRPKKEDGKTEYTTAEWRALSEEEKEKARARSKAK